MKSTIVILTHGEESHSDNCLGQIARLFGLDVTLVRMDQTGFGWATLEQTLNTSQGAIVHLSSLEKFRQREDGPSSFDEWFSRITSHLLIYGFSTKPSDIEIAAWISEKRIERIQRIPLSDRVEFPFEARRFVRQLAGCSFPRAASSVECGFSPTEGDASSVLMTVARIPTFLRLPKGKGILFLWSSPAFFLDIKQRLKEGDLPTLTERLIPPIAFFQLVFGEYCFRNPIQTAGLIIDDPLLTTKYGFLQYAELIRSTQAHGFTATTAFIPWNFKRTTPTMSAYFGAHAHNHSICVHGCDHTNDEFGSSDASMLDTKASVALNRMGQHMTRTGLNFARVMVFPQGRFSLAAIRALRRAGFLAAVNTTRVPTDYGHPGLPLAEELMPATNCHSGFPVFGRRYPADPAHYALDLFLGRPVYIVEHHGFFRGGCNNLEMVVNRLKTIEPKLAWLPPEETLRMQHLRRRIGPTECQIIFFTPEFECSNEWDSKARFHFLKPEPDSSLVASISIDGASIPFEHNNGRIEFWYELGAGQRISVRVRDELGPPGEVWKPGIKYRVAVCVRRVLSEFRDNYLSHNPASLTVAKRIVRLFKVSSEATSSASRVKDLAGKTNTRV